MAFWLFSHSIMGMEQRTGGYLFAPSKNKSGSIEGYWNLMLDLQPGDVVFCYKDEQVYSVAFVHSQAHVWEGPWIREKKILTVEGRRVDVEYTDLDPPLELDDEIRKQLYPLNAIKYAAFTPPDRTSKVNPGRLFVLTGRQGELILEATERRTGSTDIFTEGIKSMPVAITEREALVRSRVGQDRFREQLLSLWGGRCCVTGLGVTDLLRASHIKRWEHSDNRERLDVFNGFLLSPAYDVAFDAGYITFGPDGLIRISKRLTPDQLSKLGISPEARIVGLDPRHCAYLEHHANEVFKV